MTRRQALIAAAAAIPGAILASNKDNTFVLVIPDSEPQRLVFARNCFSELVFESESGEIVVKWSDVIEALR